MHLEMVKVPDKDEVAITIYAEPLKVIDVKGDYIEVEWERRRWKMRVPYLSDITPLSDDYQVRDAFLNHLNGLLKLVGAYNEP